MGIFDSLKNQVASNLKREASKTVNNAMRQAEKGIINKANSHAETFTFTSLPKSLAELQALPEASLDSPYKTAALTIAALCYFEQDKNAVFEMLDFLKGPDTVSNREKEFLQERLSGKFYKTRSFFKGATPENNYTPTEPYTITVSTNSYSFPEENWATVYVASGGADNPRPIKLRLKPSTQQWFLNDIQCLSDIRTPKADDPWA